MRHQPHLYIPAPWAAGTLGPGSEHLKHLDRVLKYPEGGPVSYADGAGTVGNGVWTVDGVVRGDEVTVERPSSDLTMAVAPPRSKERQRFIVEKLQEMGVRRLTWIATELGQSKPPRPDRSRSWAISALEQARGAWLMEVDEARFCDLPNPVVADVAGQSITTRPYRLAEITIAVGPEGGFSDAEVTMFPRTIGLGSVVLRTETAAISLAAVVLFGAS